MARSPRGRARRPELEHLDLDAYAERIRACRVCRDAPLGKPLGHAPNPVVVASATAPVLIAGQAPGTRVHASGIPFNDPSGDRLRNWLGVDRDTFYDPARFAIAPMGFCYPGQDARGADKPPRRECAPLWRAGLMERMPQLRLILAIGQYAQAWHLGPRRHARLTDTVADWRRYFGETEGPRILPLPHPSWRNTAWLHRNPWFEADLLPVLRHEIAMLISSA